VVVQAIKKRSNLFGNKANHYPGKILKANKIKANIWQEPKFIAQ
jgi:hypothetical protein